MTANFFRLAVTPFGIVALMGAVGPANGRPDFGKKACAHEARKLCPAEMKSLSRKRVEACMIAKIDETSTICHSAMLRIKAERESVKTR